MCEKLVKTEVLRKSQSSEGDRVWEDCGGDEVR